MRSLNRRLEKIEAIQNTDEIRLPYSAMIQPNGKVKVSHSVNSDFTLPNEKTLDAWIEEQQLKEHECIKIHVVRPKQ